MEEPTKKEILFDDIFQYIGGFGPYQITLFILLCLSSFLSTEDYYINFIGYIMDHWCYVPELSHLSHEQQKYIAIPNSEKGQPCNCQYYGFNYSAFSEDDFVTWNRTVMLTAEEPPTLTCHRWEIDQSVVVSSIASKYSLFCGDEWKISLVPMLSTFAMLLTSVPLGIIADKFGRKWVIVGCVLLKFVIGILCAFAPNYPTFATFRFLLGPFMNGCVMIPLVLLLEMVGPTYRTICGTMYNVSYTLGAMSISFVGYYVRDVRNVQLAMSLPLVVLFSYIIVIPESARWLIVKERWGEAEKVIKRIEKVNKRPLPDHFSLRDIRLVEEKSDGNVVDLMKTRYLRKCLLILCFHWFADNLLFSALSLNTATIGKDFYLNTFLMATVELPANILCYVFLKWKRMGRRLTSSFGPLFAGISSILCAVLILLDASGEMVTVCSLLGKAGATMGYNAIYIYTSEILPTEVRNLGFGICSVCSAISGMLGPFVGGPLRKVWPPFPSLVFSVFGLVAGVLTLFLPETLDRPLHDTIKEAEEDYRKKSRKKDTKRLAETLTDGTQNAETMPLRV